MRECEVCGTSSDRTFDVGIDREPVVMCVECLWTGREQGKVTDAEFEKAWETTRI